MKIADTSGTVLTNEYDGNHHRIVKDVNGGDTFDYYYNDKWQMIVETRDGAPEALYAWHNYYIDALAVRFRADDKYLFLHDANFNVTAAYDVKSGSGTYRTVTERYAYTPYGEVTFLDDDFSVDADQLSDIDNVHLYTGRERDAETALQLNRRRWYHSLLGRWVSWDPIGYGGGMNLYGYVGGMPTGYVDPWGSIEFRPRPIGDSEFGLDDNAIGYNFGVIIAGLRPQREYFQIVRIRQVFIFVNDKGEKCTYVNPEQVGIDRIFVQSRPGATTHPATGDKINVPGKVELDIQYLRPKPEGLQQIGKPVLSLTLVHLGTWEASETVDPEGAQTSGYGSVTIGDTTVNATAGNNTISGRPPAGSATGGAYLGGYGYTYIWNDEMEGIQFIGNELRPGVDFLGDKEIFDKFGKFIPKSCRCDKAKSEQQSLGQGLPGWNAGFYDKLGDMLDGTPPRPTPWMK